MNHDGRDLIDAIVERARTHAMRGDWLGAMGILQAALPIARVYEDDESWERVNRLFSYIARARGNYTIDRLEHERKWT